MKCDAAFYLNKLIAERQGTGKAAVINCAVEESTLGSRRSGLLPHDVVLRDNLRATDTVVISVGGNDVALRPSAGTVWNMLVMQYLNRTATVVRGDAWGMSHFIWLFKDVMTEYIEKLCEKTKPKRVVVSCIYFPDETRSGGWADRVLSALSYFSNPAKLQGAIASIFRKAICQIRIPNVEIVPFAMFSVMDGKDSSMYCAGVEPSAKGNRLLAEKYYDAIFDEYQNALAVSSDAMESFDDDEN